MIRLTCWLLVVALASGCVGQEVEDAPPSIAVFAPARVVAGETVELRAVLHAGDDGLTWATSDSRRGIWMHLSDGQTRWNLGVAGEAGWIRYWYGLHQSFSLGPGEEFVVHMEFNGTAENGTAIPPGAYQLVASLHAKNQTLSSSQPLVLEPAASVAGSANGPADLASAGLGGHRGAAPTHAVAPGQAQPCAVTPCAKWGKAT